MLKLHNFSPKAFRFQVFTTDKKIRPTSAECGIEDVIAYLKEATKLDIEECDLKNWSTSVVGMGSPMDFITHR